MSGFNAAGFHVETLAGTIAFAIPQPESVDFNENGHG
jgi:hypothetical protein